MTPYYDITFSTAAETYKRRRKLYLYADLCMLEGRAREPIVFFGGKDYLPLFCLLTKVTARRVVFHSSAQPPIAPECELVRFPTNTRTNWHYECAAAVLAGRVSLS